MVGHLADVDDLDVRRELGQKAGGGQPVDHDHVGLREQAASAHREQAGVTRSTSDEGDEAVRVVGAVAQWQVTGLERRGNTVAQ